MTKSRINPTVKPTAAGKPIYGDRHIAVPLWLWGSGKLTTVAKNLLALLEFHRNGKTDRCNPRIRTLAAELAVSPSTVKNALRELRKTKLITIAWEQRSSNYTVAPAARWLEILMDKNCPSETRPDGQKLPFSLDKNCPSDPPHLLLNRNTSEASQPATEAGRLAELAAVITAAWPKLPGRPGARLLARIAATVQDDMLDEFRALLLSKARKVESFGLAESLAQELRDRRRADDAARESNAADKAAAEISRVEAILRDPSLTDEERPAYQEYLDALRRKPTTEPTRAQKGAA